MLVLVVRLRLRFRFGWVRGKPNIKTDSMKRAGEGNINFLT
jgi:hypothetical protein